MPITSFLSVQTLLKCQVWSLRMSKAKMSSLKFEDEQSESSNQTRHFNSVWTSKNYVICIIINFERDLGYTREFFEENINAWDIRREIREEALQMYLSRGLKINEIWVVLWKLTRFESCTVVETAPLNRVSSTITTTKLIIMTNYNLRWLK